jgi:predicted RNA-binding protein YlxR (DUF448 family)
LGCGARDDQHKLIRLTAPDANQLKIDPEGDGRGGYLHYAPDCWQAFTKKKSVYRAFHREIARDARENLVRELKEQGLE